MGSINALVSSCGTANHLPHRKGGGHAAAAPGTPAAAATGPSSLKSLPEMEGWQQSGCRRSNFTAQICKGRGEGGRGGGWSGSTEGRGNAARMRTWRKDAAARGSASASWQADSEDRGLRPFPG